MLAAKDVEGYKVFTVASENGFRSISNENMRGDSAPMLIKSYQSADRRFAVSVSLSHGSNFGDARISLIRTVAKSEKLRVATESLNLGLDIDPNGVLNGFTDRPIGTGLFVLERQVYWRDTDLGIGIGAGRYGIAYNLDPEGQEASVEAVGLQKLNVDPRSRKKNVSVVCEVTPVLLKELGAPYVPDLYSTVLQWVSRVVPGTESQKFSPEELVIRPLLLAGK